MVKLNNLANHEVPNLESPEFIVELHGGRDRRSGVTACVDSKHALTLPFVKSSVDIQPGGRLRTPLGRIDMEVGKFNPLFAMLHHGSVILCPNGSKWVAWMKEAHAAGALIIAQDSIEGFQVATIFLGIDFNEGGIGPPLWFETVVFRRLTDGSLGFQPKTDFRYRTAVDAFVGHVAICQEVRNGEIGNEPRRTGVHAGPMLIKAYRIESRRHGSIDCQPVLMGIVHFTEGIDQDQLFEQERVAVNLVMDHSPFSHDVKRGAETWDAESTNVDDELLGVPSFEDPLKNYRIWLSH